MNFSKSKVHVMCVYLIYVVFILPVYIIYYTNTIKWLLNDYFQMFSEQYAYYEKHINIVN